MPTVVAPFGPQRAPREAHDACAIAEDIVAELVDRATRLEANVGDVAG